MKREILEQKLNQQLEADFPLDAEELAKAQELINNIVEVNSKIKNLTMYAEDYKAKLKSLMEDNKVNIVYSSKGRASLSVSDITKIDGEKVRAVIDEFNCGTRHELKLADVAVTKTQQTFRVSPINIEEEI